MFRDAANGSRAGRPVVFPSDPGWDLGGIGVRPTTGRLSGGEERRPSY